MPVIAPHIQLSSSPQCSAALYLLDTYGALYGASAMAANGLLRYILSAAFPLFTVQSELLFYTLKSHFVISTSMSFYRSQSKLEVAAHY